MHLYIILAISLDQTWFKIRWALYFWGMVTIVVHILGLELQLDPFQSSSAWGSSDIDDKKPSFHSTRETLTICWVLDHLLWIYWVHTPLNLLTIPLAIFSAWSSTRVWPGPNLATQLHQPLSHTKRTTEPDDWFFQFLVSQMERVTEIFPPEGQKSLVN